MSPRVAGPPKNEQALAREHVSPWLDRQVKTGVPLWWMKVHGGPMQRAGVHDYLLCVGGLFLSIELKHPTDMDSVATPLQRRMQYQVDQARGRAFLDVRSLAEVQQIVTETLHAAAAAGLIPHSEGWLVP
jgi:hypothetical protein